MHTVDVGPYLYLACIYCCTDEGCSVVATTTLEIVDEALVVHADETLCNVYFAGCSGVDQRLDVRTDICEVGLTVGCQTHELE